MFTPELEVLKPIDPAISHSDDYEIFVLSNVRVAYESNGKPASLLDAYTDRPLRVEGRLEAPDRSTMKYLVKRPYRPVDIEVRNVTRFSYAQMTDGTLVIWALGEAGWYEIQPTRSYKEIYQDMVEAVEILYFVTDIYNEPRKKGGGPSAALIFQEYAEDERYPCNDPVLAQRIFYKHHEFLIMCFLNRAQGVGWSNTPLYQHFRKQFPKAFEAARARIEGRFEQVQRETKTAKASPATASGTSKPRSSRGKTQIQKSAEAPKKDENWWEAAALFEFMQKAVNQRVLRPSHGHITLERVAKLVVKRYEIEEEETALRVLLVHGQNLCYMMDHPRRQNVRFFADEPIYRELSAGHNLAAAEVRRAEGVELRPRRDHASLRAEQSDDSEDDEDVITTPKQRPDRRKKKGRLSVLRPKSAKYSGKGKGVKRGKGKGKMPVEEEDDEDEVEEDSGSDIEIDTPTQALSPSRQKRKFSETNGDDDEEDKGRRKRAASESVSPESPPSTESDEDTEGTAEADLPLRHRSSNLPASKLNLVAPLVSTPLPTYEANGPRDSWICNFDGCSQRIYGVSKDIGRQLVTEHLEDHAKGRSQVVGILLREEERLRLPVNNLLKKIREMSESQTLLFPSPSLGPSSPVLQPRPIQRSI